MVKVGDILRDNDPRKAYRFLKVTWIHPVTGWIYCDKLTTNTGGLVVNQKMKPIKPSRIGKGVRQYHVVVDNEPLPER